MAITLLGTAHVSKASAEEVRREVESGRYDVVAIELDAGRHAALVDPDRVMKTDLVSTVRQGRAGAMVASLALGAFQQRLADQMGIDPGQEMREAIAAARERRLPLVLIDRDIGVTLRRIYRNVPWWQRFEIVAGLIGSVLSKETIEEDEIERLKEGDVLEATFAEFAQRSERLYAPLIRERDAFMVARLVQEARARAPEGSTDDEPRVRVLAVVGAGHVAGMLSDFDDAASAVPDQVVADLNVVPPPSRWQKVVPWAVVAVIVAGFVVGFVRDPDLGRQLLGDWFWINMATTFLGTIVAGAHPVTIVGTTIASPFTSLNPTVGAGLVAAALETWRRKPSVGDFANLRRDVTQPSGWYRNRVARTLLVTILATLGSAAGTYVAGARIFTRLF